MLPFMADAQAFQGETDMWCTCKEAWDTGAGDEEEHAVILFNYLYYIHHVEGGGGDGESGGAGGANVRKWGRRGDDKPSSYPSDEAVASEAVFLVIGKAVPEGTSVYVMIRDTQAVTSRASSPQSFIFINPCTGQLYPASDPRCPMVEVACIVTPYNVWANVQVGASPYELEYDILNPDHWRPFFGRRLPPPSTGLHSIQEDVTYAPTSTAYALDLERSIKELYVAPLSHALIAHIPRRLPARSIPFSPQDHVESAEVALQATKPLFAPAPLHVRVHRRPSAQTRRVEAQRAR
jgi:hypothetical protein